MKELNKRILEALTTSGLSDFDQRSAIGLARTWVEKRKPVKPTDGGSAYNKRDDLGRQLVTILEEYPANNSVYLEALAHAREHINKPYLNTGMLGMRARLLKPKDKKEKDAAR